MGTLRSMLRALACTAAAVCKRVACELRQSKAEPHPAVGAALFVAAALGCEEALWLSLCFQVTSYAKVKSPWRVFGFCAMHLAQLQALI